MSNKYYNTGEVLELTNTSKATIRRWAKVFKGTHMVLKHGSRLAYHVDFITFIRARENRFGPPSLPSPDIIARLFLLWRRYDGSIDAMASRLKIGKQLVNTWLEEIGCQTNESQD